MITIKLSGKIRSNPVIFWDLQLSNYITFATMEEDGYKTNG